MKTIFEKIINREIPANILYEDDQCIAFLDISQITEGHTLIVSKEVYSNFFAVPDALYSHLFKVTKLLARALEETFSPAGFNIINNCGEVAGQSIFHFHLHLIPRFSEDELKFVHKTSTFDGPLYEKRAALIKEALSKIQHHS